MVVESPNQQNAWVVLGAPAVNENACCIAVTGHNIDLGAANKGTVIIRCPS